MGTSLDCIYPDSHKKYINKIVDAGGVIISESMFTTVPHPSCFPRRNRIISGLSRGVLIIEAARKSGSLITARCAIEQGRDVFAIPGNINNPQALGCLDLIADGAKLIIRAEDIIDELSGLKITHNQHTSDLSYSQSQQPQPQLNSNQQQLLTAISGAVTNIDDIVGSCNLSLAIDTIASELIQLEIMGYVTTVAGGYTKNVQ
jgi:DNA processing protein